MAGASPLGYSLDAVKRLEDAGCAAVVLPSLFEEQITMQQEARVAGYTVYHREFADILSHFPAPDDYALQPDAYAEHVRRVKLATRMPVIASLNGRSRQSWLRFATMLEQAGADALELNMYQVVTELTVPAAHVEAELVDTVAELHALLGIPLAVKLSPFFTAIGNITKRLADAGAAGLVLFNRFYQPDIEIGTKTLVSRAELSTSADLLLRIRWIAILYGQVKCSLAVSGGVATPVDGIKAMLAGADAVQVVSALLRHGPAYLATLHRGLAEWMEREQFSALQDVRGALRREGAHDPSAFERAQYIQTLHSWHS
jgi:dihydroorotate dehydrogenase (fumarate)